MQYLITTIAALVLVGCGETQQPAAEPEVKLIERVEGAKAPDISIGEAAESGNIEEVRQHIAAGTDVNAAVLTNTELLCYGRFQKVIMKSFPF